MVSQILFLAALLALWELASSSGDQQFIASKPSRAWTAAVNLFNRGELWRHLGYTIGETVLGFTVGTLAGIIIAALLWWSDFLSKVLIPILSFSTASQSSAWTRLYRLAGNRVKASYRHGYSYINYRYHHDGSQWL